MSEEKKYMIDTLKEVQDNMELFYQQKKLEALNQFQVMLNKILKMVDILFTYRDENDSFSFDEKKIQESLTLSMQALEEGDLILVADTMQYEFVEYVNQLVDLME